MLKPWKFLLSDQKRFDKLCVAIIGPIILDDKCVVSMETCLPVYNYLEDNEVSFFDARLLDGEDLRDHVPAESLADIVIVEINTTVPAGNLMMDMLVEAFEGTNAQYILYFTGGSREFTGALPEHCPDLYLSEQSSRERFLALIEASPPLNCCAMVDSFDALLLVLKEQLDATSRVIPTSN